MNHASRQTVPPQQTLLFNSLQITVENDQAANEVAGLFFDFLPDGTIREANQAFFDLVGLPGYAVAGRSVYHLLGTQERLKFQVAVKKLTPENPEVVSRADFSHTIGPDDAVKWNLRALFDAQNALISIQATGQHLSHYGTLDQDLTLSSMVLGNTREGIFVTDSKGIILWANKAFARITGFRLEECLGNDVSSFGGQQSTELINAVKRVVSKAGVWEGDFWQRRRNRHLAPVRLRLYSTAHPDNGETYLIGYLEDISEIKKTEGRLQFVAYHDQLTKLPNRTLFKNRLAHAVDLAHRNEEQAAVLYLDLDHFKKVNDTFGHQPGDSLLQMVGERLCDIMRQSDTVARMGGDEFALLLEGTAVGSVFGATTVANKILEVLAQPFSLEGRQVYITPSIGISVFPTDGKDPETLLKNADLAMYRAKELGRNSFQFFAPDLNARAHRQWDMECYLRRALEQDEFHMEYQPVIDAVSRRMIGVEALLRWENLEMGRVFPDEFIPLAESSGLICGIGEWALRRACTEIQSLSFGPRSGLQVSVNISGRQIENPGFLQTIRNALNDTGLPPEQLILEITESLLMENLGRIRNVLIALRELGVRVAIDDFGTGYSSLNSLMVLPIDTIKIDKSFIAEISEDQNRLSLVQGIISIGHNLELDVVAEGVENARQADLLQSNGCDSLQGFHFSRSVPLEKLSGIEFS